MAAEKEGKVGERRRKFIRRLDRLLPSERISPSWLMALVSTLTGVFVSLGTTLRGSGFLAATGLGLTGFALVVALYDRLVPDSAAANRPSSV